MGDEGGSPMLGADTESDFNAKSFANSTRKPSLQVQGEIGGSSYGLNAGSGLYKESLERGEYSLNTQTMLDQIQQ